MRTIASFFVVLACFLICQSLYSQNCQGVERQVAAISVLMIADGYSLTHDITCKSLRQGESNTYSLNLTRGYTYKIIAVCDGDCGDLDSWLYDERGNLIDSDTKEDDLPIVVCTPKWTGAFDLKIKMHNCKINPCRFGIVIFGK